QPGNGLAAKSSGDQSPTPPWKDGEVRVYRFTDIDSSKWKDYVEDTHGITNALDNSRRAVFINGMNNSGEANLLSSMVLSLVQLCPVVSVYNRESDFWGDVAQCLRDKLKYQGQWGNPKKMFE